MRLRTKLAAGAVFATLALGGGVLYTGVGNAAYAQNFGQRVVMGNVQTGDEVPVAGATVFLRNAKSKAIRSYTTTPDGHFRFAQVNMSEDFDVWAEKEGKKSPVKTVSSWDTRKETVVELRLK